MFINDINIWYYFGAIVLGCIVGYFLNWYEVRLTKHEKVLSFKEFNEFRKKNKVNYIYIVLTAVFYCGIVYKTGTTITTLMYIFLIPMLLVAFAIDYKEKIIPNRLNLTMFEIGLVFTFIQGITNINSSITMLLGMAVGAGIFIVIALIAGLLAGKEAMGLGDVKLMGALGLYFGFVPTIVVAVLAFVIAALVAIGLLIFRRKNKNDYIPFGPFIVIASIFTMFLPIEILVFMLLKMFTLGTYKGELVLK